jgi:hypothetical protein
MITYPDGRRVLANDVVLTHQGRQTGVVHAVVDNQKRRDEWGIPEYGLEIEITGQGMHFWPAHSLRFKDEIRLISRRSAKSAPRTRDSKGSGPRRVAP